MAKLWEKGYQLDPAVEQFTVGDDYALDMALVRWDCVGSIAHAAMLAKIGILTEEESRQLRQCLSEIVHLHAQGKFVIAPEQEDVHTAVEGFLTEKLGAIGRKVHTARSRNDQVILDLRLYMRDRLLWATELACDMIDVLLDFAEKHKDVPIVGRTHFQRAMPSSVGLWAGAIAESLLDDLELLRSAYRIADQCPLGSAASYGVNLPIDRKMVSDLLGFEHVQGNVLYANNSRGKVEAIILSALAQVMNDLSKMSVDIILWSMPEFGYFILPEDLCGGSSLMPQKRNPAFFELTRAKAATLLGCYVQVMEQVRPLISGYHRDFQETKRPLMTGFQITEQALRVCGLGVSRLGVDRERCIAAFTPEVFATDRVLRMVGEGTPFRDAYKQVALSIEKTEMEDPVENIRKKTHLGATGNLGLDCARRRAASARSWSEESRNTWEEAISALLA
jgi:argininosuccinate lyase